MSANLKTPFDDVPHLADLAGADDLYNLYGLPPVDYETECIVALEREAEEHLQHLARIYGEQAKIKERLAAEIARLEERADRILEPLVRRAHWHEQGLQAFLWRIGQKTWKGLHGTLKRRAGRERVEVVDEPAYLSWARSLPPELQAKLLRTKVEVSKTEAKAYYDSTGTEPPGVRIERGEDGFSVEVA